MLICAHPSVKLSQSYVYNHDNVKDGDNDNCCNRDHDLDYGRDELLDNLDASTNRAGAAQKLGDIV